MLLRVVAALYLGGGVEPLPGTYDQVSYDALAQRVAAGHGFSFGEAHWPATRAGEPTAHWSYVYTGFLAAVYKLVGHQPLAARLLQAVVAGASLPLLTWGLARRALGAPAAVWAAAISAVYVYFVYYSPALMTETFTLLAVLGTLAVTIDLAERPTDSRWVVFGVLVGLGALLRQVTLVVVPFLAVWILWRQRTWRAALGLVAAGAVALLCLLPALLRNYKAFDRFVLVNTNAGYAFFWANHPIHGTDFQGILDDEGPTYQSLIPEELRSLDEAALNDTLMARGWEFVRADPVRYLRLSVSRLEDYFLAWPRATSSTLSNLSRSLSFAFWLPFMLAGLLWARHTWPSSAPCYVFVAVYTAVHLLSWSLVRYRLPVDAVLVVFGGYALSELAARQRSLSLGWSTA